VDGDDNGFTDIFVRDRDAGTTSRVSLSSTGAQANNNNWHPTISHDGRFVVYSTDSDNLVVGDVEGAPDVLSHDRLTGITRRHSVVFGGPGGDAFSNRPSVSANGAWVVFQSFATNLVDGDTNQTDDIFIAWGPATVLRDQFETGDLTRWSAVISVPAS
jgi:Tol biopolymer transport system component